MTPKEKASELVFMFSHEVRGIFFKKFRVKRCALIAVNEILLIDCCDMSEENFVNHIEYWEQVQQEIEKL